MDEGAVRSGRRGLAVIPTGSITSYLPTTQGVCSPGRTKQLGLNELAARGRLGPKLLLQHHGLLQYYTETVDSRDVACVPNVAANR